MTRRLRLSAVVAAMLALVFGVGMASAAFACEAGQSMSVLCVDSSSDAQSVDRGCARACRPLAPAIKPAIEPIPRLFERAPAPSEAPHRALVSRPIGPEPPPPRSG